MEFELLNTAWPKKSGKMYFRLVPGSQVPFSVGFFELCIESPTSVPESAPLLPPPLRLGISFLYQGNPMLYVRTTQGAPRKSGRKSRKSNIAACYPALL